MGSAISANLAWNGCHVFACCCRAPSLVLQLCNLAWNGCHVFAGGKSIHWDSFITSTSTGFLFYSPDTAGGASRKLPAATHCDGTGRRLGLGRHDLSDGMVASSLSLLRLHGYTDFKMRYSNDHFHVQRSNASRGQTHQEVLRMSAMLGEHAREDASWHGYFGPGIPGH